MCGNSNPIVLDFHHLRDKILVFGSMGSCGWSIEKILKEIDKCIVLCSNCHRLVTYAERNKKRNAK